MKINLQQYWEELISRQTEDIQNFIKDTGLVLYKSAVEFFDSADKGYILDGWSKYRIRREDFFFKKLRESYEKRMPTVPLSNNPDEYSNAIAKTDDKEKQFEDLKLELSVRAINVLKSNHISTYKSFVQFAQSSDLSFLKLHNCGKKTANELNAMAEAIMSQVKDGKAVPILDMKSIKQSIINEKIEELCFSTRTFNALKSSGIDTMGDLIIYDKDSLLKVKKLGRKCIEEIESILSSKELRLGTDINSINLLDGPVYTTSFVDRWRHSWDVFEEPSFMGFAIQFKQRYGHYPMLFLLKEGMMSRLSDYEKEIINLHWGIDNNKPLSFEEIARKMSMSIIIIKRICEGAISRLQVGGFLEYVDWKYYIDTPAPMYLSFSDLMAGNKLRGYINERIENPLIEINLLSFAFQLKGMKPYWVDKNHNLTASDIENNVSFPMVFLNEKFKRFKFEKALREVRRLQKIKTEENLFIPLSFFLQNELYWPKSISLTKENEHVAEELLAFLFTEICNAIIKDDCVVIGANCVNYGNMAYDILRLEGTSMSKDYIYAIVKKKCNDKGIKCDLDDASELVKYLTADARIIPIGKSGYWTLNEWGETVGSIREISIQIMKNSKQPIHINDLTNLVMGKRPDSNEKSISSVIRQTTASGELLLFQDDYIGYPNKRYIGNYVIMPQSFDEWMQAFKDFVSENRRLPYCNQDGYEGYLYRWHYRSSQYADLTSDEILKFDALEKELANYPQNATEYVFLQNCNLYKKYVESNKRMLTKADDPELFNWFYKSSRNYSTYNDNRNKYFGQLLQYISKVLY